MGAGDIPIWVMGQDGSAVVPSVPGRYHVDFVVPTLPPLMGTFIVAVSVTEPVTGTMTAAVRFYDSFDIRGNTKLGLVDVPYVASTQRAGT
jgi:ABC-2 type transport system ATP-binding protein